MRQLKSSWLARPLGHFPAGSRRLPSGQTVGCSECNWRSAQNQLGALFSCRARPEFWLRSPPEFQTSFLSPEAPCYYSHTSLLGAMQVGAGELLSRRRRHGGLTLRGRPLMQCGRPRAGDAVCVLGPMYSVQSTPAAAVLVTETVLSMEAAAVRAAATKAVRTLCWTLLSSCRPPCSTRVMFTLPSQVRSGVRDTLLTVNSKLQNLPGDLVLETRGCPKC